MSTPRSEVSALGRDEKILIVEDDDDVREYTRAALVSLGYRVYEAWDAVSGVGNSCCTSDIVLLLTDLGLPGMNGRRLVEEAQVRLPNLKVIYTAGDAQNAIVHSGLVDP